MLVGRRLKVATCLLPDITSHDDRSRDPSSCMRLKVQQVALGGAEVRDVLSYVASCKSSAGRKIMATSHHFRGLKQYADKLMDLAEGKPVFKGRGQKPSNKEVLTEIKQIKKCKQSFFFGNTEARPCSCGWYTKAAVRRKKHSASSLPVSVG